MARVWFRDLWGHPVVSFKFYSMCQWATPWMATHVYDLDTFHASLQRLGPKLCRAGTCMG